MKIMNELTIYNTSGDEISPQGEGGSENERIEDFAITSLELAVFPQDQGVVGCFDVKKSNTQRSEQFWGAYSYHSNSSPIIEFKKSVETQIEDWGYILDEENTRSELFQYLDHGHPDPPGEVIERKILESLAEGNRSVKVGVRSPIDAIGLLLEYLDKYSVGIIRGGRTGDPSGLDIIITIDSSYSGITPIGETNQIWESEKREIKKGWKRERIQKISNTFQSLRRQHNMTSEDIMREVPELSTPEKIRSQVNSSNSSSIIGELKKSPKEALLLGLVITFVIIFSPYVLSMAGLLDAYLALPEKMISFIQSLIP